VFAAVDDVAGEFAEAEREFSTAEIKDRAEDSQDGGEDEESAAEVAERVHRRIIPRGFRGML